jgi:FdhE protein
MTAADTALEELAHRHPEWGPWLAVVQAVLRDSIDARWEAFVPMPAQTVSKVPLLAHAQLVLDANLVRTFWQQLLAIAWRSGTPEMATLKAALDAPSDVLALIRAALNHESDYLKELAVTRGIDAGAFHAVAVLLPVPFLHACNRCWAQSVPASWTEGYCPVCGAWPAFAEVRGIERSRYLRCARCGGEWQAPGLNCVYCGMTDHNELVSLVPENSRANSLIEACARCRGYVKSFTTLQGSPPGRVMLDDLASVELDVAAVEQGYQRPEGGGYLLGITVAESTGLRGRRL